MTIMKKLHLILKLHIVSCCLLDEMRRHSNMLSYRKNKLKQNAMAFKIRRGSCTREGEFNQSSLHIALFCSLQLILLLRKLIDLFVDTGQDGH